jgi:hypothetical protein
MEGFLMRGIIFSDGFKVSRVFKKVGFDITQFGKEGENTRETGIKIITFLLENICEAEAEITELLAGIFEVEPVEFAKIPMEKVITEIRENSKLLDFFTSALQLTKPK